MTDKGNGRTMEDLDERGARRTTHLIEATYVACGDARTRVAHENQRSGDWEWW